MCVVMGVFFQQTKLDKTFPYKCVWVFIKVLVERKRRIDRNVVL